MIFATCRLVQYFVKTNQLFKLRYFCFVIEIVSETQLRKYGKFLEDYASQLNAIEKALDDTVGESWDLTLDPISLQVSYMY